MSVFNEALKKLIGIEGDFSDDPADSGGKTRFGITEAVARQHGYTGQMSELPYSLAAQIYRQDYWDIQQLDKVAALSAPVALELFDTGVNCGVDVAGEFLQQSLNVLNRLEQDFDDIEVDGQVGSATLAALARFLFLRKREGETVLLRMLNCLQGARYVKLAEHRRKDERFVYGWFRTRIVLPAA